MSINGTPDLAAIPASGLNFSIVAASWHEEIMTGLLSGAISYLNSCNAASIDVIRVPGSFELPIAVQSELHNPRIHAAIALGLVLRGDTPHFDYVCSGVTNGLMQVMLSTGKPIGFGLLTCNSISEAFDRAGLPGSTSNKGAEAANAAVALATQFNQRGSS